LKYEEDGTSKEMELPLTIADWAATEGRFKKHFSEVQKEQWNDDLVPFHEFLRLDVAGREGKRPFIHVLDGTTLERQVASAEMVSLAEERLLFWSQLRQLAGVEVPAVVRQQIASAVEQEFQQRQAALTAEYELKIAELKATYALTVARRMAEGLLRIAAGKTMGDLVSTAMATGAAFPVAAETPLKGLTTSDTPLKGGTTPEAPLQARTTSAVATVNNEPIATDPYIESALCTSCNECTGVSNKLFAYNADKQAYIKDAKGGTYAQLVKAAELCPVSAIHPGTPLNPNEKDLAKWIERAARFN
jgi:pyruvate-ferredoxin/flavodoxin oxidoreductase